MIRTLSVLALLASITSASASTVYVYAVASAKKLDASTTRFTTPTGLTFIIDCNRRVFDDATDDFVSSFGSKEECDRFVADASKAGSEVELRGASLSLRVKL